MVWRLIGHDAVDLLDRNLTDAVAAVIGPTGHRVDGVDTVVGWEEGVVGTAGEE